ncbi:MAG: adenylyltransferase/cytidyltransferase family protein [Phycisphaerales bacterium]|nr:adenylyltransferase/cytidyltransferase family protein [Phycisphaerales bacterium]
MDDHAHTPAEKILTLDRLVERRADARRGGQRVVQCHGCFDIVHPGHIRHLRSAAAQGDRLLVSITADRFVNKGAGRPVFTEDLRADNLAALSFVDWVYINDQQTASELLTITQPDVYVKGAEYEGNNDPRFAEERAIVETHGGRVVFSSSDVVFSSSALVERVEEADSTRAKLRMLDRAYDLSPSALEGTLGRIAGKRIVVVGETILDTYIQCTWPEVSSESPMLSLRPLERSRFDAGCAVIALHLAALGVEPVLITTLPGSSEGEAFIERMDAAGVRVHAVHSGDRIPAKDRYLVGREKKMKIDHASDLTLDTRARETLIALIEEHTLGADACIIADYGLGMFTPRSLVRASSAARDRTPILSGDVSGRRSSLLSMRGAEMLCPSEHELRFASGDYDSSLPAVVWKTLESTRARSLAVTLNEEGVIHFSRRAIEELGEQDAWANRLNSVHIPSFARHPIDTLGCGDTLLAITTAALTTGEDPCRSLVLGSLGAAIQASTMGNAPITHEQLVSMIRRTLAPRTGSQQEIKPLPETPPAWT